MWLFLGGRVSDKAEIVERRARYVMRDGRVIETSPIIEGQKNRTSLGMSGANKPIELANYYIMDHFRGGPSWRFAIIITASGVVNFAMGRMIIAELSR